MITTSEVAVSLTIDNNSQLPSIENELRKFGTIRSIPIRPLSVS